MDQNNPRFKSILLLLPLLVLVSIFYVLTFTFNMHDIYAENHAMEDLQVTLIALAGLTSLFSYRHISERWQYWYCITLTLLCYSFLLRELDIELFNVPQLIITLTSGLGRTIILAMGWSVVIFYMLRYFNLYRRTHVILLQTSAGRLLIISAAFLFLSYLFDRQLEFTHHVFYEELVEVCAYYCLFIAAYFLPQSLNQLPSSKKLLPECSVPS